MRRKIWPDNVFYPHGRGFQILFGLVALEIVIAMIVGWRFLAVPPIMIFKLADMRLAAAGWFIIPLVWIGFVVVTLARRRIDHPTAAIRRIVSRHRAWLLRGFLLTIIHVPLGRAFGTLKSSIPHINPYTWDKRLADIDYRLLGTDAWRLTHSVIGESGTLAIDRLYAVWGTYLIILAGWISFTRARDLQIKAALAFNLSWIILGSLMATFFASVGPCFYEAFHGSDRFSPLMAILHQANAGHPLFAFQAMDYLTDSYGTAKLGAGISAMPSMHVSMATLGVILAFAASARPWIKALALAFLAVILVGSVHLGWHYAVDGIASILLTIVIWFACASFVEATRRKI